MARTVITITSDADFAAFCKSPPSAPSRVEFRVNRVTLPPTGLILRAARDIVITGETAPFGRLLMTGGRFTLLNCESITISRVGFRSQRLADPVKVGLFETYERSWKPFAIQCDNAATPSRNITLRECSFSGHTDEIEVGPADHASWFATQVEMLAAIGIAFDRCLFGPGFINTGATIKDATKRASFVAERQFHNMSLSVPCADQVAFTGCLFVGANRRSPQLGAKRVGLAHCVVDDWGSMCVGLHAGSDVEVNACHFIRGPHTNPAERAVSFVEGTWQSPFAKLGPVQLAISPNCTEYNTVFGALRKGWDIWQEKPSLQWAKKPTGGVLTLRPISEIMNQAGCGDSLDQSIRAFLLAKKHVPWMDNYTTDFAFPKV